ncbi:MAG: DUF4147 domain-containing protein [Deltaproteobacteria bacterium]|nr:MAG: DUF4147 domain-containing protein [Deltaproteobacteria bacterium]
MTPRVALEHLARAAIAAGDPGRAMGGRVPAAPPGRTLVVSSGKAAPAMARAAAAELAGEVEGIVVVPHGLEEPVPEGWRVLRAAHPVPDVGSEVAAREVLRAATALGEGDRLLFLLSGGTSSLLCLPGAGLDLEAKRFVHRLLLDGGLDIEQMNTVRRHLSGLKGGRLASAAWPAETCTLFVSDVPRRADGTLAVEAVGSGPTVGDPTCLEDARAVVARLGAAGARVAGWLAEPQRETPKPGDARLARAQATCVLEDADMVAEVEEEARRLGCVGTERVRLAGSVGEVARVLAGRVPALRERGRAGGGPVLLVAHGEATVALPSPRPAGARGGRNTALAMELVEALGDGEGVHALCFDTDGIDGTGPHAGAFVGPGEAARWAAAGWSAGRAREGACSAVAFEAVGGLWVTGRTGTNLSDLCLMWVEAG